MKIFTHSMSTLFALLMLGLSVQVVNSQSVIEANTILKNATIYSRGASLHHSTKDLNLPSGNSDLVLNQIAHNVDLQSIRISSESNKITVLSISFERDYLAKGENQSSQFITLKEEYEKQKHILDDLTNARKGEESTLALLEENRKFGGQNGVSPTSLAAMIKYFRDEYKLIAANIITLKTKEDKQQKIVTKLKNQMREAGGNGQDAGQIVVRLHASQPIKSSFDINYFTDNVSWTPFYEIRVDNLNEPVQLTYNANVSQQTGIDWNQVKLSFSSGNPRRNNNAPQLNPWWVGFQRQNISIDRMLQGKVAGVQAESMDEVVVTNNMAVVEQNQLTTSFVVNAPYDIFSNQKPQAVQLKQYQLPAKYSYFTAPRLDEAAFLIAKISDWSKYNLLPGNANLIIDNNFAGSSYINSKSTEDTLILSLGRDERIITARKRIDEEGSTSFFGNHQKRVYTYEISVRNSRKEAVEIDVKEQFPLSTEKDIEIKLLETSNANVNNDKGELTWVLYLKAGETKKLKVSYSVKLPKNKVISGM